MYRNTMELINYKCNYWLHFTTGFHWGKIPLPLTIQFKLSEGFENVLVHYISHLNLEWIFSFQQGQIQTFVLILFLQCICHC